MPVNTASSLLQLISAAVTPVVMISACAALILGVNSKHSAISERIRSFVAEYRVPDTTEARRQQIRIQIDIFYRRFLLTWFSLSSFFAAVGAFTLMTILIVLSKHTATHLDREALMLFVAGTLLMLVGSALEMGEIGLSNRSLRAEISDILALPRGQAE